MEEEEYDDPLDRDFVINENESLQEPEAGNEPEEKEESNQQGEVDSDSDDDAIMTRAFDSILVRRCPVHGILSSNMSPEGDYNLRSLSNQENDAPAQTVVAETAEVAGTSAATAAVARTSDEENKEDEEKPSRSPAPVEAPTRPRRLLRSLSPEATASRSSARIQNRRQQQQQQQQEQELATPTDPNDADTPTASTSNATRRRRFTTTGASSSLNDLASPNMDISCVANRTRRRLPFYKKDRK